MAPNPEPLRSRGAKHSVHDQYWRAGQQSQVTWGDYLCVLSPNGNSSSTRRRMDPAGFEPASATWTECCVPVTPRALSGVSVLVQPSARSCVTILLVGCQIGRKSGSLGCAQGRLSTLPQHWGHSHISEIREMWGTRQVLSQLRTSGGSLRRAVAGALQHPKVCAPRTHGLPVLVGHNP